MRARFVLAFILFLFLASLRPAPAQMDGYWTNSSGGSWANAANWLDSTIASGEDAFAYFGISLYPINAAATFTLDGPQTVGNLNLTTQAAPANWVLNTGAGGPLTLDATFDFPAVTVGPGLSFAINVAVAGTNGLEKLGAGTLVLGATNTYTGGTALSAGTLLINGQQEDPAGVTVASGGVLGGTGTISGPVILQTGGTLSGSGSTGSLTISKSLTMVTGSKTIMGVNAATLGHSSIQGLVSVTYGGTLTVTNFAGTPAIGQNFPLFSTAVASGNFSSVTPQLPGTERWRFDPASGALSVVSANSQPVFANVSLAGPTKLMFAIVNGTPGATNYLIAATNLALPKANWTRLLTNVFDVGGTLTITNSINAGEPQSFYQILALP
jgi:autotransporter-associated beta strand protein